MTKTNADDGRVDLMARALLRAVEEVISFGALPREHEAVLLSCASNYRAAVGMSPSRFHCQEGCEQ